MIRSCECHVTSVSHRARFRPGLSEREAAKTIIEVVEYSCLNFRFWVSGLL